MAAHVRDPQRGLPIAALLGMLVALAFAAAFVAIIAVVIFLPPRPPDVMRGDVVAAHFQAGYAHMRSLGAFMPHDGMVWSVRRNPPAGEATPAMRMTRRDLAQRLNLQPDQVRVAAANVAHSDVFVFRVRDIDHQSNGRRVIVHEHFESRGEGPSEAPVVEELPAPDVRSFEYRLDRRGNQVFVRRPGEPPPPAPGETPEAASSVRTPPAPPQAPETPEPPEPPLFAPAPPGVLLVSGFEIGAQLPDGRWLVMRQGRNWEALSWIGRAILVIGGALTVLSLLALWFARRLSLPIRNFSEAVQAVGVDPQSAPVAEEGPRELRGAARAVNTMQARLRALIADRTKTLAAVAHDMRTPLMRLRLVAENAPPDQRDRMAKEIGEVEALVASFIAFARDDPAEEARVRIDLSALLQSIADDHAEAGRHVSFAGDERLIVTGQSLGLKRLFGNLVDNALKYGANARIALKREEGLAIVEIADDGPGVPAAQRETVFEPFVRLSEGASGAGLGLPAARSIARAHGGDIAIRESEKGALLVVTLPA